MNILRIDQINYPWHNEFNIVVVNETSTFVCDPQMCVFFRKKAGVRGKWRRFDTVVDNIDFNERGIITVTVFNYLYLTIKRRNLIIGTFISDVQFKCEWSKSFRNSRNLVLAIMIIMVRIMTGSGSLPLDLMTRDLPVRFWYPTRNPIVEC